MILRHGPQPQEPVRVAVQHHRWETATFLHWAYPPETIAAHLPAPLQVEPWGGRAWVGAVLFQMHVQLPGPWPLHVVPPFPETNLRTYVVGPDGTPGIWFWSLDAASPSAVAAARILYGLPYRLASLTIEASPGRVAYRSRGRRVGPARADYDVEMAIGGERLPTDIDEFDHYLTARFTLWNRYGPALLRTPVEHPPWVIHRAAVTRLHQRLTAAAGLPEPSGDPLVHYSPGVDVRIGPPAVRFAPWRTGE